MKAAAPITPAATSVAVVRMRPKLAASIRGKHEAKIPAPFLPVRVGERLLLVEWNGGSTGRADLVHVLACVEAGADGIYIRRSFCWQQGKHDTDLSTLSLTIDPERPIPLIGDL